MQIEIKLTEEDVRLWEHYVSISKVILETINFEDNMFIKSDTEGLVPKTLASNPDAKITPEYYKVGGIETIDYLKAKLTPEELKGFLKGNVIKYLSRSDHKGGVEDLKKAKWYLEKLIEG